MVRQTESPVRMTAVHRSLRCCTPAGAWNGLVRWLMVLLGAWILLASGAAGAATCFAVDDDSARIVVYDRDPPVVIRYNAVIKDGVGGANLPAERIEAAYFDSVLNRYYVVVQDAPNRFGYVDAYLGAFITVGANMGTTVNPTAVQVGTGNGGSRITGLTRNPVTNRWYVVRVDGYLFEINPATGVYVSGAFNGNDYLLIRNSSGTVQTGIEDLAFDQAGKLFVIQNDPGPNQLLQDINLITGYAAGQVSIGIDEAEGLALTNGSMRLIIGAGGGANVRNFYSLNTVTGVPTLVFNLPDAQAGTTADYEATGCNDSYLRADLALTKTVTPAAVAPGGTLTYLITLVNQGIDPAYRVKVTDQLDPGMSFVSSTIGPGCTVCSFDPGSGVWTVDKIDIGQVRTLTLVVSTAGVTPNTFVNNRAQVTQSCETATGACTALADPDSTPNNKTGAWTPTEDDEAIAGALVTIQPSVGKAFLPTSGVAGATTTLVLTLTNANTSTAAVLTAALVDTYPAGLLNAAAPAATTSCSGGTGASATAGGNSVSLASGATIPAGGSCTVTVRVTASSLGAYTNTVPAGALTVTVGGITLVNVVGTTAQYQVTPANLGVLKDFTPDAVSPNGTSTLKITFTNPTGVPATFTSAFVDTYPAGLVNASTPNAQTSCSGSGAPTATAGGASVSLPTTRAVPANGQCTMTVVVTASTKGYYTNTIAAGNVSTSVGTNVGPAVAVLQVDSPSVSKVFSPASVQTGSTSTLIITFSNPLNSIATITQTFTDVYPAGIVNHTTPAATDNCGGGNVTASAGLGTLTMPIGTQIPALGSCQVSVVVQGTPPATLTGTFVNTVPAGALTTTLGSNTDPAAATLTIASLADLRVTKVASVSSGTPGTTITYTVTVANLGSSNVPASNPAKFTDVMQGITLLGPVTVTWVGGGGGATNTVTNVVVGSTGITADFVALSRPAGDQFAQFVFRGVPSSTSGYVTNTAAITAPPGFSDTVPGNNTATVAVYISPTVFLTAAKTNGVTTLPTGGTTTYTLTFTNAGPSPADGAVIKDTPSAGLNCTAASCSATGGADCGTVSVGALLAGHPVPTLPAGGAVTVLLTCTVTATGQ